MRLFCMIFRALPMPPRFSHQLCKRACHFCLDRQRLESTLDHGQRAQPLGPHRRTLRHQDAEMQLGQEVMTETAAISGNSAKGRPVS